MPINFVSDINLGDLYRDTITGFEGVATDISFNVQKCNRVYLTPKVDPEKGDLRDGAWFDAPNLMHMATETMLKNGSQVEVEYELERTGGPHSKIK